MLKDKIAAVETQMKAKLAEARATFTHSGDKGTAVEAVFRAFLSQYLPRRLDVGYGEVIDIKGRRSRQTDVVIVNEDHPFTFTRDQPGLFFIEGICGAGEVKTNLTSDGLEKALENSCQFKLLEISPARGAMSYSNDSDLGRFYKWPPWFLFALETQLSLTRIHDTIVDYEKQRAIEACRLADAVFVLDHGWIINFGDGKGSFQFRTADGKSLPGWIWQNSHLVLFDLLGWLSIVMPRMLQWEPILPKYMLKYFLPEDQRLS